MRFFSDETYKAPMLPASYPITLFDAADDTDLLVRPWRNGLRLMPLSAPHEAEYQIRLENLFATDNENLNAAPVYDSSFKHVVLDAFKGHDLKDKTELLINGRSLSARRAILQLALVTSDGASNGALPNRQTYRLRLAELNQYQRLPYRAPTPAFCPII